MRFRAVAALAVLKEHAMVTPAFVFRFRDLDTLGQAQKHLRFVSTHVGEFEGSYQVFTFEDCTNLDLEQKTLRIQVGRFGALDIIEQFQYVLRRQMDPTCCTLTLEGRGELAGLTLQWPLPKIEASDVPF